MFVFLRCFFVESESLEAAERIPATFNRLWTIALDMDFVKPLQGKPVERPIAVGY